MIPWLPSARIVQGASDASVSWQFVNADGDPAEPASTVTVSAVRSDGSSVTLGAVAGSSTDPRTATIALAEVADVDWITVTWADGGTTVGTEVVEVVGRPPLTPAIVRGLDSSLTGKSSDVLRTAIRSVEDIATRAMHRSPFRRFYTERLDGSDTDTLVVSWPDVRELVWARVYTSATAYTELSAAELASVKASTAPLLIRTDGGYWPCGRQNIEVGYRFGFDVPNDLRGKLALAVRHEVTSYTTGIPDRAVSMQTADGFNVSLATPGTRQWTTGIPDVDEALIRYAFTSVGIA